MTTEEAKAVENYFDAGYIVLVNGSGYVDSPVHGVYEDENGDVVYDSEVFTGQPLKELYLRDVIIAMPMESIVSDKAPQPVCEIGEYEVKFIDGGEV